MIQQLDRSIAVTITKEMRNGVAPILAPKARNTTAAAPTLLMVHGYCASENPWESPEFTDAAYFLSKDTSLTHEVFAQKLSDFANTQDMTSFSMIGHSQGGHAALHLLNYLFSGMDQVSSGTLIQTVGTPWLGCSGAGSAANLAKTFGYGCGENFDLTKDGCKLWLAGITTESRQEVSYYTTTYEQGTWFGDYCNMAVNLILEWPNDGVAEIVYTKLTGGTNLGNKQKWCHTTDMAYPAQYDDTQRNTQMNANAGR